MRTPTALPIGAFLVLVAGAAIAGVHIVWILAAVALFFSLMGLARG